MDKNLSIIFDELCKGNISILDANNNQYLINKSVELYNKCKSNVIFNAEESDDLKTVIMICNLLYNRTDMIVLPVEDGIYDILNEKYKSIDPNFQVGSVVVDFKSKAEHKMMEEGKVVIHPFTFIKQEERDEIRQEFADDLMSFDKHKFIYQDVFYNADEYKYDMNISKRVHNTSHNHPDLVGTLDKAKYILDADAIEKDVYDDPNTKILERDFFCKHIAMGIIRPDEEIELILELKYDGISCECDCSDIVISARTRGDTGAGLASDITPILYGYKFTRNEALKDRVVGVKFEAIMTNTDLSKFNKAKNTTYANCRTAIIGLFGSSDANKYRDFITLIPLAVDRNNVPEITDRHEEVELLNRVYRTKGEPLRHVYIRGNYQTCLYLIKKFAEEAKYARNYLDFMFDGIVVSYTDEKIRAKLGRENYINKFSMAVKFDPMVKLTRFLGYTYEIGQTGNVCPMINYSPVEFFGTIHTKSSGASYNRFVNLGLRPNDIIEVTYTNDVMCYVTKFDCEENRNNPSPLCEFPKKCPICGSDIIISDSGKSAVCPNVNCDGRKISRMSNMLQKLNIKGFSDSTIIQIGLYSFHEIMQLGEEDIQQIGPTNASNFINALNILRTAPQDDYKVIGSLGFSNIGSKKWKLILSTIPLKEFNNLIITDKEKCYELISSIKGLGESAATTIINEYPLYKDDIDYIINNMNIIDSISVKLTGKQIRFTGCRNTDLENQLRSMGHDADGSGTVTKQTDILLVPYDGFSSTKTSKVSPECIVVSITEFMENMSKYLM